MIGELLLKIGEAFKVKELTIDGGCFRRVIIDSSVIPKTVEKLTVEAYSNFT